MSTKLPPLCHLGCRAYEDPNKCRVMDKCHPMEPIRDTGFWYCPRHDPNLRPPKHPAGQR